ncbi:MAG: protein kinase [Myxococcaceae bacterium]|nr:protein kinase [Myxococcaceae bacterium]
MECPDPEELARFADGLVTGEAREALRAHADGCASCREVLVTLARSSGPPTEAGALAVPTGDGERPRRGDLIGRYVVLDARGAGGMGLVMSAHDNQLDRNVALKLVRPDLEEKGGAEKTRARLLREAQLMARVRHPNVVTIYDVGTLGERVFIAMELIDGVTLRAWLRERRRSEREICAVFVQAGRGLAAAHAAGVVHRDFKPDNVLIDVKGDAHVMDFGLAWSVAVNDDVSAPGTEGTPAYMAPEQLRGGAIDARTDQFAFCVALYEALTGQRPFQGTDRLKAPVMPPHLPQRLALALTRGLSATGADRFESMEPLLEALQPRSRASWWLGLGAAAAVVAAAGATFVLARQENDCAKAPRRLAQVWDAARRDEVRRAFAATGVTFAGPAFESAAAALDRRTGEWRAAFERTCESGATEALRSRQRACLDARLGEVDALTQLFVRADPSVVEHAAEAAAHLKSPASCLTGDALTTLPLPDEPGRRAAIAQVRLELAKAEVLQHAGRTQAALDAARAAITRAKQTKYPPVEAEAWLQVVEPLRDQGHADEARAALDEATVAAEAGRHFEALLKIAVKHVRVVDSAHTDEADGWIRRAEASLEQTPNLEVKAELDSVVAVLRLGQRRTGAALERSAAARAFYEAEGRAADALGERHIAALAQRARGNATGAVAELQPLLADYEKVLGPTHPRTQHVLVHLAEARLDLGDVPRALEDLGDVRLAEAQLTPSWAAMRSRLEGDGRRMQGRLTEAEAAYRRALELAPTNPQPRLRLAAALREQGRLADAATELEAATTQLVKTHGALSGPVAVAQLERAQLELARGSVHEADVLAGDAITKLNVFIEDAAAPEHIEGLLTTSRIALAASDPARAAVDARVVLERVPERSVQAARAKVRLGLPEGVARLRELGLFPLEQGTLSGR